MADVLLVESNQAVRSYLSMTIENIGHTVAAVGDYMLGVTAAGDGNNIFELAVICIDSSQDTAGFRLVQTIGVKQPSCAIIVLTTSLQILSKAKQKGYPALLLASTDSKQDSAIKTIVSRVLDGDH